MSETENCPFCRDPEIVMENELAFADYDSYPVNPGHCLIILRRHIAEYFEATAEEKAAIWALVDKMKPIIDEEFNPDGYNVGVNIGKSAGQSVPHVHIHMIPRYQGDMEDPRGGVRGVIPHKQKYVKNRGGQSKVPE
ncbi:MAG: HIT domain-containing protein [Gammaproteobacteria bacterium]|nr:HIT domain-containing protein [Gammaproteobacteria bacterium]